MATKLDFGNNKKQNSFPTSGDIILELKRMHVEAEGLKAIMDFNNIKYKDTTPSKDAIDSVNLLIRFQKNEIKRFMLSKKEGVKFLARELAKSGNYDFVYTLKKSWYELAVDLKNEDPYKMVNDTMNLCRIILKGYIAFYLNHHLLDTKDQEKYKKIGELIEEFQALECTSEYRARREKMHKIFEKLSDLLNELNSGEKLHRPVAKPEKKTLLQEVTEKIREAKVSELNEIKANIDLSKLAESIISVKEEYKDALLLRKEEKRRNFENKKGKIPENLLAYLEQQLHKNERVFTLELKTGRKFLLLEGIHINDLFDLHTKDKKGLFMNVDARKAVRLRIQESNDFWLVAL